MACGATYPGLFSFLLGEMPIFSAEDQVGYGVRAWGLCPIKAICLLALENPGRWILTF